MKKSFFTIFTLISGIFLVIVFLVGGASDIARPSKIPGVLYSDLMTSLIAVGVGSLLIYRYFQRRKEEVIYQDLTPNSIEENQYFESKQNRIFAYLAFITSWGSIETWVLNNYLAGFTLVNTYVVADLVTGLILLFLGIQLFQSRNFIKLFVTVYLVSISLAVLFYGLRGEWINLITSFVLAVYFIFAVSKPVTKAHYKLTNYLVLPLVFVVLLFTMAFDVKIDKLWEDFGDAQQKSININSETAIAYQNFITEDLPTKEDINELITRLSRGAEQEKEVLSILVLLKDEYSRQLTSESQILTLKIIDLNIQNYTVLLEENNKIKGFAEYAMKLDFNNLTDEQRSELSEYRIAIENYTSVFNDIGFKIDKATKERDE